MKYELANTDVGVITATPIVRGSVDELYLYEEGSGYGSNVLNLEKPINITKKFGKDAQLKPIISNGKIRKLNHKNFEGDLLAINKKSNLINQFWNIKILWIVFNYYDFF